MPALAIVEGDMDKIAIIKSNCNGFERYFSEAMSAESIDIFSIEDVIPKRPNSRNMSLDVIHAVYQFAKRKKLNQYERVVIFDAYGYLPGILLHCGFSSKLIVWMWNTLGNEGQKKVKTLKRVFPSVEFATFDPGDARVCGIHLLNQFYIAMKEQSEGQGSSIFFVGLDKGRYETLVELAGQIPKEFTCDFHILVDEGRGEHQSGQFVETSSMDYREVVCHVQRAAAVVDIVKEGQIGMTLRVLEALYYGKKLISNNEKLLSSEIYATGNVYVMNHEDSPLQSFLTQPLQDYPSSLLEKYSFDSWLNKIRQI